MSPLDWHRSSGLVVVSKLVDTKSSDDHAVLRLAFNRCPKLRREPITAALDARRVGVQTALTLDYLAAAAPAYLTSTQQAKATPDWLDNAIRYAVEPVQGAASCLIPVAAGMGKTAGYLTADYLHQTARTLRRTEAVPDPVWQALVTHHHPQDGQQLGDNAERRGKIDQAIAFYSGVEGEIPNWNVAGRLADLLAEQGEVQELRQQGAGNHFAAMRLADLLAGQGEVQELRQRAAAGDRSAAVRLADLLAEQGEAQEAIAVLRQPTDAGDWYAAEQLIALLAEQGRIDDLELEVRAGTHGAAARLARIRRSAGNAEAKKSI
ncbi:tetratricopeptide repeat protein [Actinoplanes xinjiangensis]|uniref:tetratricopeptide repeat protein n=1 Tax=Actinoplanes xinjiangensis TaxID=512350 RepID=UPI0034153403